MSAPVDTDSRQETAVIPAEWVVRWFAVGTIMVTIVQVLALGNEPFVTFLLHSLLHGSPFDLGQWSSDFSLMFVSYALPLIISLTVGFAGVACLVRRAWGRNLLLMAIPFWILGTWLGGVRVSLFLAWFKGEEWAFYSLLRYSEGSACVTAFAFLFALVLTRPEVKAVFRKRSDRGFEPVMQDTATD